MSNQVETGIALVDSLYRISRLVSETDDVRQALEVVLDEIVASLKPTSASVALVDPDTSQLDIEVARNLPPDQLKRRLGVGEGITGQVVLHGQPILVRDVRLNPHYIPLNQSVLCEMAAPMIVRTLKLGRIEESVVGVVNVDSEQPGAFSEQDLKLLTVLTNEATRVLARLWHLRQLRETTAQLETLINAGQQLVRHRGIKSIAQAITIDARRLIRSRRCAVFLVDPVENCLRLAWLEGPGRLALDDEKTIRLEESALGVAVRRGKQVQVDDLARTEEHHFVELVQEEGLQSMLATPLVHDKEVIGLLNVYTDHAHRFSNDERRLLQGLASLGAVAIQNARLYQRVFASEETVRKNERLTTLGLLSAEIAHEIRNPLTVIKLLFDSLDLDFAEGDPRTQDAEVIHEKLNQLEDIVGRVLEFGRSRTGVHARYELNRLVEDSLRLVRPKLEQAQVAVNFEAHPQPLHIEVHKGQLQQVMLNLIINAMQAMPQGGQLILSTCQSEHEGIPVARLSVRDTGCGIPERLRPRIFESFLTGRTEGTGLGLAISKQILKAHRGGITLTETSPAGTCFVCYLPLARA